MYRGWLDCTATSAVTLLNPVQCNLHLVRYNAASKKWAVVSSATAKGGQQQVRFTDDNASGGIYAWYTCTAHSITVCTVYLSLIHI